MSINNYNYSCTLAVVLYSHQLALSTRTSTNHPNADIKRAVDDYNYSTFSWDRLGIAESQHGEAVNEIQSALEIAALYSLTLQLRQGAIPGIAPKYSKIVHIGHSYGSIQSYSLAALHPDATDGLILTGFTQSSAFIPYFALGGNFVMANGVESFKDYPDGYLAAGDPSGVQTNFLSPGAFGPELLELGYKSGQPVTVGELLTIGAQTSLPNPLKGPVLVITGGKLDREG